jgi:hypothetical protein
MIRNEADKDQEYSTELTIGYPRKEIVSLPVSDTATA